jgi:hypothetical protein
MVRRALHSLSEDLSHYSAWGTSPRDLPFALQTRRRCFSLFALSDVFSVEELATRCNFLAEAADSCYRSFAALLANIDGSPSGSAVALGRSPGPLKSSQTFSWLGARCQIFKTAKVNRAAIPRCALRGLEPIMAAED